MKRKWLLGLGLLLLVAVIVIASVRGGGGRDAVRVYAQPVARRSITQSVKASGQIHPRVKVNISAHVVGKIEKLFVRDGDAIRAGEPFLELERESFLAVRDDARAQLAMAQTELEQAQVALADQRVKRARAERLHAESIASKETLESAQLEHSSAELRVRAAREGVTQGRALLDKAEDDLRKTTIFSPLTGRVIALNAEQGEVVVSGTMNNPASVIGTVADLSEVLAEVDVDETEVVDLRPGLAAEVVVDALPDVRYAGRVVEVGSSGYTKPTQPDVQFFRVKILLERPDDRLRPGMSARAEVQVAIHADALTVPIQAVVERTPVEAAGASAGAAAATTAEPAGARPSGDQDEVPVAFVVDAGKVRQRPVKTGVSDATDVEVVEGLKEGERVVTGPYRSLKKLRDGDRIRIADPKADREKEAEREEDASVEVEVD